jgi:outer membrane protein OmpA-like peptidoglycan-associated protein
VKALSVALAAGAGFLAAAGSALAQTPAPAAPVATAPASQAPTSLSVYFATGSSAVVGKEQATLDEASRIFNDGKPIVMIITGMADATGSAGPNLLLSQKRADAVFEGLVERGLPPDHFQILATGASESIAGKEPLGSDPEFRRVEITWR